MTRLSKMFCAAVVAATFTPLAAAHAQATEASMSPSRYALELYLAQYSFDAGESRTGIGGFGARVMFGHSDATRTLSSFFSRARAGAFLTYTAEQKDITTLHVGGQADFPLFATPVANGFLDPFVSLGAGVFRTSVSAVGVDDSQTHFALTPAAGTLIPITGSIAIRGDLRSVIIFADNTTNNFVAEGGISIGF